MGLGFLDHMRVAPDHRIAGMVTYPLDEILLATLTGVVCGADDWEGVEEIATGGLDWLRGFLSFVNGIPTAQTFRKVFRLLDAPREELVARLNGRATAEHRADDTPEIIANRLEVYDEQTRPVISYYDDRGLVKRVSAVSKSSSIFPASLSCRSLEPSSCKPRRPISSASICDGGALRIAL